jgi:bifunctional non-homologous end joining protein LigD
MAMALEKYQRKRKFDATPEPKGKPRKGSGALKFVVQKHQASRLHYDFRLEMEGVLKSWAVPKGPSLNPEDKRLAMMVEDHPYDYRTFEGIIPEGNYGAGTVMIWDEGIYSPGYVDHDGKVVKTGKNRAEQDKEMRRQLHAGHLTFLMEGQRLKGEFALIKIKNSDDENAWLLIKKGDKHADAKQDITHRDKSAITGRSLDEITNAADQTWHSNRNPDLSQALNPDATPIKYQSLALELKGLPKASLPHDVKPMLATLVEEPFNSPDWVYEIKWDGYRILAHIDKGKVTLRSRGDQDYTQRYKPVAQSLASLGHNAVLDGEMVVVDQEGRSKFQLLQNYHNTGQGNLTYYVFDILQADGHNLTGLPLQKRKQILQNLLPEWDNVKYSEHIATYGKQFFELAREQGLEGIMAKRAGSKYLSGKRSSDWLKIKTHMRQEAVIGGYTEPRGGRQFFGALVLGVYQGNNLVYIGHTGGGFGEVGLKNLYSQLKALETNICPFATKPTTNTLAHWVKPKLVCEVEFSEWTEDGSLRHPIFVGLRSDKDPKEVVREMAKPINPHPPDHNQPKIRESRSPKSSDQEITINRHKLKLTHLDKVYWPDDGYTKGDLIDYYREVAPVMMPYLKDRPMSLNRHPNGISGASFYQKDLEKHPDWVKTQTIHSESEDRDIHYLVCRDEATLIYMANLGCIEVNPWSSCIKKLNNPDWCVIDLDPEGIGFEAVIQVARQVHKTLDSIDVPSYPKTSGASGIHIYIPLGSKYNYDQTKDFAHLIVQMVNTAMPDITSILRNPAKRQKRVYLDYLQNRRGQTLAAPYAVRPKRGATVSTPLKWEEVKPGLHPNQFTFNNIHKRLDKVGDLWQPVLEKSIDMAKVLKNIEKNG